MIIIGYQGIGKSTLARQNDKYIDLESSCFWYNKKDGTKTRWYNWAEIYTNIAIDLSKTGNVVFTSSHEVVRNVLAKKHGDEKVICCHPDLTLKDEWINKLKERYNNTKSNKDFKAYKNAEDRYEENINELIDYCENNKFDSIVITNLIYDLEGLIENIFIKEHEVKWDVLTTYCRY